MPMVIIEAHAAYPFPFVYTPQRDINHIISYYTYFGFERLDNPLRLLLQFFGHDVNEWATRSNFCWDTSIENFKDTGDFIDNKDLTPSEIAFYWGVYGEEMILFDKECNSLEDENDPSKDMISP